MPLVQTRGAASAQGFGEFAQASGPANYIEDVFSCFLYTGNGTSQTITNNIDLSTEGGLVWIKPRSFADNHSLFDTARGALNRLRSNDTSANTVQVHGVNAFNSTGFSITGANGETNQNTITYASWTFREQPKFFDVVTYTGTGSNTTIAHSLGAVPGSIIIKRTDTAAAWAVYHRSLANTQYLVLNTTAAVATGATWWNSTTPTSSVFSVGTDASVNASGGTYVAYVFAHDAGGFGLTGTDNVVSCGSFTTDGSGNATVNLGYEPQWLLTKVTDTADNWVLVDTMRGWTASNTCQSLRPNTSGAEISSSGFSVTSTGFTAAQGGGPFTYIYIAIRRGPMKVPTVGTSVYNGITRTGTGAATNITGAGFPIDLLIQHERATSNNIWTTDRLRGTLSNLDTQSINAENTNSLFEFDKQDGFGLVGAGANVNTRTMIDWVFRRAPGSFDVVCWTGDGTGSSLNVSHNLGTIPLLLITKKRSTTSNWVTNPWNGSSWMDLKLNTTAANTGNVGGIATSTTFNPSSILDNVSATTYVTYLFATCPGVSKVGSYTGNGSTQTIDCGFTGGARFVLIKRTDASGDWYVYDTARGMTVLTDPYLFLNDAAVEVATLGSVTTVSTGFALNSSILADINEIGGTYIFLAIA